VTKTNPEPENLAALVRRAQDGSEAAMEALVCRFQDRIAGLVYSLIGKSDAIEDVCHNAFLKMISGLPKLRDAKSFEPWLFRIARNVCNDHFRKERVRRLFVPFELKHEPVTRVEHQVDSRLDAFRVAVEGLPLAQKELILLLAENDWSYEQLAEITNCSVSSVKSRLFRAREFLRGRETDED
jgi:RNA polymerase sigma-70 factor, ECF subfamily